MSGYQKLSKQCIVLCVGSKLPSKHNDFYRRLPMMRLNVGVFKPISTGEEGRGVMSFKNIENKGRFIKNSNLGSTGSYKKCISLMETDRNCQKIIPTHVEE